MRLDIFQKRIRRSPQSLQGPKLLPLKWVDEFTPIIFDQLQLQSRRIVQAFLVKQALAVEGMLPEHATGPTVDGVDRSLVHPLRRLF